MEDSIFLRRISLARTPEDYTAALPVVRALQKSGGLSFSAPVTFFVGENGSGKSTLLEAIAVASGFNPEGGSRNFCFSTNETHAALAEELHLVRGPRRARDGYFLRAESFYNAASYLDELDEIPAYAPHLLDAYGGKSLHEQSHGESFFSLLLHRFAGGGLYLLDEPEAALSPQKQFAFLSRLHALVRAGSQFLIATHSPILSAYPNAEIFVLSEQGIQKTPYRQTDPYILTREFLNAPEHMLSMLLADPD
ncbi:AAA family ATPase [Yeguia hominis]|uniref:AAA family ATPase n=1 Tax=Yeguia hominis TaxID=2763662 RepID=A0A926D851_9FIRM|nr:AAA family ATPase [Yeguia hominis]MBC8533158.1 AAA family ATPase [Yeguia hominis]